MRVLIVSLYWPPAGGAGVQRPLKLAGHLAELGHDVHVLAPDDPKWLHRDDSLTVPEAVTVHRCRNVGPRARRPAEELARTHGLDRARSACRAGPPWAARPGRERALGSDRRADGDPPRPTASDRGRDHDVAARLRSPFRPRCEARHRRPLGRRSARLARRSTPTGGTRFAASAPLARLVARHADAVVCVSEAIAGEMQALAPRGTVRVIANGCDFDDFDALPYRPGRRFRITHAGSFFGRRDPRPFLDALTRTSADVVARFVGDFRERDRRARRAARPRGSGRAACRTSNERRRSRSNATRRPCCCSSPRPTAEGAVSCPGRCSSTWPRNGRSSPACHRTARRRRCFATPAPVVVVPADDRDAIAAALDELAGRWRAGELNGTPLSPEWRASLSRRTRAEEYAALLEEVVAG